MLRAHIRHCSAPFALLAAIALLLVNVQTFARLEPPPRTTTAPIANSSRLDQAVVVQQRDRSPVLRNQVRQPNPGTSGAEPLFFAGIDIPMAPAGYCHAGCAERPMRPDGGASSYAARAPPSA